MTDAPQTFPKTARVRKRRDYLAIQGTGRKLHTESFMVFVAPSSAASSSGAAGGEGAKRVGITVSKRVGPAVVRNRVKRFVRESYRRRRASFPGGLDVVLVAKKTAAELDFARTDQEIARLCARLSHR